jgi:hypothetical protein
VPLDKTSYDRLRAETMAESKKAVAS